MRKRVRFSVSVPEPTPPGADFMSGCSKAPVFDIADTGGCSGAQIIEALGLGRGHMKFGVSLSNMRTWVAQVEP